jgi:hypothetical protein
MELGSRVSPEQQNQLGIGMTLPQILQGMDGVRRSGALQLARFQSEGRISGYRQGQHGGSVLGGAAVPALFERLLPGRHEAKGVQTQGFDRYLRDNQVSVMNRIERSTEEADHPAIMHRPG